MKIYIYNDSEQKIGGGWTFIDNFVKGFDKGLLTNNPNKATIIFIPSSSMVGKTDNIEAFKNMGKKIVLRVDNAVRDSRNRGSGMSKMKRISDMSDMVIYQSRWAFQYLQPYLKSHQFHTIYNGVDTDIFKKDGESIDFGKHKPIYLYSRYNKDETKRWEKAWFDFQMIYRNFPESKLVICGRFSDEIRQYNFDFFNGENYQYIGVIESPQEMAKVYRGCNILLAPYYNDCYSNTIQEALACGLHIECDETGGNPEILKNGAIPIQSMCNNYFEVFKEITAHVNL